jgi:HEAT repeat protein
MKRVDIKMSIRTCLLMLLFGAAAVITRAGDLPGGQEGPSPMLLGILENAGIDPGDPAALVKAATGHQDSNVRWVAVEVLGLRKEIRSRDVLRQIVAKDKEDRVVRETAALALARMGDAEGLKALRGFMENPTNPGRQVFLAARLAELDDVSGYRHVVRAARSEDPSLREMAVEALPPFLLHRVAEQEGGTSPGDLLLRMAQDESAQVRQQFLVFLPVVVGKGLSPEQARAAVKRLAEGDPEVEVRESAELLLKNLNAEDCQRNPDKGECQ